MLKIFEVLGLTSTVFSYIAKNESEKAKNKGEKEEKMSPITSPYKINMGKESTHVVKQFNIGEWGYCSEFP